MRRGWMPVGRLVRAGGLFFASCAAALTAAVIFAASASGAGTITTIAGDGFGGYRGDGVAATSTSLYNPTGVAVDGEGNVYIADWSNDRVRKVDRSGTITTFAGDGKSPVGTAGDGGPATSAQTAPIALAFDHHGNLFISECSGGQRVREVHEGVITTVAGTGGVGYTGDGGPATSATLWCPAGIALDGEDNLFIADRENHVVREVHEGTISTVAGNHKLVGFSGDGGPATSAALVPESVALDSQGNLYITDYFNQRVREVHGGIINTVAGTGVAGSTGDGGPATGAELTSPDGIAVDGEGHVYITTDGCLLREFTVGGTISTIAGTPHALCGFSGDGCLATSALIGGSYPGEGGVWGLALDNEGRIDFADYSNWRVRQVNPRGLPAPGCGSSPGEEAAGKRAEEEAAVKKRAEEEAAAKKRAEEEAAARKRAEEEAARRKREEEARATCTVRLTVSSITVRGGIARVSLATAGGARCVGNLTLTARRRGKKANARTIASLAFSIAGGSRVTVGMRLNGTGRALLAARHGRLGAVLVIVKTLPSPRNSQSQAVTLIRRR